MRYRKWHNAITVALQVDDSEPPPTGVEGGSDVSSNVEGISDV